MEAYVYWFVLAVVLLGIEMATVTFYFLVLSAAAALGGIVALAGLGAVPQFSLSGLLAVAGTLVLRHWRKGRRPAQDIGLDVGQAVKVVAWNPDGTARVFYRGAEWDAEPESPDTARDATLYIKLMQGSTLRLTQHKPK